MTAALLPQGVIKLYNRTFFGIPQINVNQKIQSLFSFVSSRFNCIPFLAVV